MDRPFLIQQYYLNNRCVEYVLSYSEVISLIQTLARLMPDIATNGQSLALLMVLEPMKYPSHLNEDVMTDRVSAVLDVKPVEVNSYSVGKTVDEVLGIIQSYYDV